MPALPSPYIARRQRGAVKGVIGLAVVAALIGFFGWLLGVGPLATALLIDYTETTGEVVSEGTTRVSVGSRRSRHMETRRTVTVEYTVAGLPKSDTVQSETIEVGDTVTVWVDETHPSVAHLERPSATTFNWVASGVGLVITALVVWALVAAIQKLVAITRFTPERSKGRLLLTALNIADAVVDPNKNLKAANVNRTISVGINQSDLPDLPAGTQVNLVANGSAVPAPHDFGQQLEALLVRQGLTSTLVAARTNGPDQQWWMADLSKPTPPA